MQWGDGGASHWTGNGSYVDSWAMHPPFLFWPCQKRNGPCTVQREKTLWPQLCTFVQSCCTGVGVSVPAPILPGLRARLGLLQGRYCRPVADGAEVVGVQNRIWSASLSARSASLRAAWAIAAELPGGLQHGLEPAQDQQVEGIEYVKEPFGKAALGAVLPCVAGEEQQR